MKKIWRWLFNVPPNPRSFGNVLAWWEIRRFIYNGVLATAGITSLAISAIYVKGWFDFISPPLFPAFFYFFGGNLCYTGGWIIELISKNLFGKDTRRFAALALKLGIAFSIFVAFTPHIFYMTILIREGEVSSPYAKFTRTRPNVEDLCGRYELDYNKSISSARCSPSTDVMPYFILNCDGSFTFDGKHYLKTSLNNLDVQSIPLTGSWSLQIDHFGHECWSLALILNKTYQDSIRIIHQFPRYYSRCFLQNESPPYNIYIIMGDPDSWQALIYKKK
jgi:hypothetical protein